MQILFEDQEVIVCYKPSGVPTQTASGSTPDMVSLLKNYLYKKQANKKEPYVAVIHRLDQPVEGILVFAKTPEAAKKLNQSLQKKDFSKQYQAVVYGRPQEEKGNLVDFLVKEGHTNLSKVVSATDAEAKEARLFYEVLTVGRDGEKEITLVRVVLDTGRHHQIRVQMSHMGCPIWGDCKYCSEEAEDRRYRPIALCAYHLEFPHPKTGKQMIFEIEPRGEGFLLLDK